MSEKPLVNRFTLDDPDLDMLDLDLPEEPEQAEQHNAIQKPYHITRTREIIEHPHREYGKEHGDPYQEGKIESEYLLVNLYGNEYGSNPEDKAYVGYIASDNVSYREARASHQIGKCADSQLRERCPERNHCYAYYDCRYPEIAGNPRGAFHEVFG